MRLRLMRHFVLGFWRNVLLAGVAGGALLFGLLVSTTRPGTEFDLVSLASEVIELLPALAGPLAFLAACVTVGGSWREGSLIQIGASGQRLRGLGGWLLLGALPIVAATFVFGSGGSFTPSPTAGSATTRLLLEGGFFFRSGDKASSPGAALLTQERRVLFGRAPRPPGGSPPDQVRLFVEEEWRISEAGPPLRPAQVYGWSGKTVSAPRALFLNAEAANAGFATLQRWLESEPERADLRFARNAVLLPGVRTLVLLVLGFGFWLRSSPHGFLRRSFAAGGLAVAYLVIELACTGPGLVGDLPPDLAAFGPAGLFGVVGLVLWLRCDQPPA